MAIAAIFRELYSHKLLQEQHFAGGVEGTDLDMIEIDARWEGIGFPDGGVCSGLLKVVYQYCGFPSQQVVDDDFHINRFRQTIADIGLRVEGVGVVRVGEVYIGDKIILTGDGE